MNIFYVETYCSAPQQTSSVILKMFCSLANHFVSSYSVRKVPQHIKQAIQLCNFLSTLLPSVLLYSDSRGFSHHQNTIITAKKS